MTLKATTETEATPVAECIRCGKRFYGWAIRHLPEICDKCGGKVVEITRN